MGLGSCPIFAFGVQPDALLAKIEVLNKYEAMIEEMKNEAHPIHNSIEAEMEAREVEELIAGQQSAVSISV